MGFNRNYNQPAERSYNQPSNWEIRSHIQLLQESIELWIEKCEEMNETIKTLNEKLDEIKRLVISLHGQSSTITTDCDPVSDS